MESASVRPVPASARSRLAARLYGGLVAAAALPALAAWLAYYPLDRFVAGALLAAYGALVFLRPASWLLVLPGLWPVVDLAAWTGHIHFTESDALALATLAALGLREALSPPVATLAGRAPVRLTVAALVLFGLLAASVTISGLRGLLPLPLDAAALVGYNTNLNALRMAKGFVLAFLLIPFLHLAIRRGGEATLDRFVTGLILGFASCGLAALWERLAFTSLTDFASDYRTTGMFWEMHVGGASLDAWLILGLPFALLAVYRARTPIARALVLAAVAIGSYALFTTFSRIVYGALMVSLPLLGGLALLRPAPADAPPRRPLLMLALAAGALLGCALSFPEGGYRGLLAFVGLALLAWPAGGALAGLRGGQLVAGLVAAAVLLGTSMVAMLWVPKGVYLVYALSWLLSAGVLLAGARGWASASAGPAVVTLIVWVAGNAVLVSAFWSEPTRFTGSAVAAGLVLAVLGRQALGRRPLWVPQLQDLFGVAAALVLGAMLVTTLGGYYMGDRLSAAGSDAAVRIQHFERGLSLMHGNTDKLIGIGMGRFPDAYFWTVDEPGVPGSLSLHRDADGRYMRLGGPKGKRHGDEVLNLSQRIAVPVATRIHYRLRLRSDKDMTLILSVCRKNLLYPDACNLDAVEVKGRSGWQQLEADMRDPAPGPGPDWAPRPAVFSVSQGGGTHVDLDDLQLLDARAQPLLRNGDFEQGVDFWFFSSDRDQIPWHAQNLFVLSYIEQGLLGLVAMTLTMLSAGLRLLRHPTRLQAHAPALVAALAGITAIGMVDSVVDTPRVTVFLVLLLWLALTLRRPPPV